MDSGKRQRYDPLHSSMVGYDSVRLYDNGSYEEYIIGYSGYAGNCYAACPSGKSR